MNNTRGFLFAAGAMLATALFFSCSSDDDGGSDSGGSGSCPISAVSDGSVTCGGQTYRTVQIGEQVWFAENLNYNASGSKCYEGKAANCSKYGRLYNWETAKKACPDGWHLPSNYEWHILIDFAGGEEIAGAKLKAKSGWNYNDDNETSGNGTDDYGFSALPGGRGILDGEFSSVGNTGDWWSASEYDSSYAYDRYMSYGHENARWSWYNNYKSYLNSVRCLLGDSSQVIEYDSFTDERDGKEYKTIVIETEEETQTWLAENLDYEAEGSVCYDNDPAYCQKYGRLYDWATALTACPGGWHLPTQAEWNVLGDDAEKLKAERGWDYDSNIDRFGFSALPGGSGRPEDWLHPEVWFADVGLGGCWWSANEYDSDKAYYRAMYYHYADAYWYDISKDYLFSIRCIKD